MSENYLITANEAKNLLGIHLNTLYRLAKNKQIPSVKIGSRFRFNKQELMKIMTDKEYYAQ